MLIDQTLEKILLPSLSYFKEYPLAVVDILDVFPRTCVESVIIAGGGPTLRGWDVISHLETQRLWKHLLTVNQSSWGFFPRSGLLVQTDPQPVAYEKAARARRDGRVDFVAAATNTAWRDCNQGVGFFRSVSANQKPEDLTWNAAVRLFDPEVKTEIIQAGTVVAAQMLLVNRLVDAGLLEVETKRMYFTGVDLALEVGVEYGTPLKEGEFIFGGYLTTAPLLDYYNQIGMLVHQLRRKGWDFATLHKGLLCDIMEYSKSY